MRLLLVRLSALGDALHSLPALELLRAALPDAELTWAAEPLAAELLEGHPALDRVVLLDRPRPGARRPFEALRRGAAGVRALRAVGADAVIDVQGLLRSALVARAAGAPRVLGPRWAREGARFLYGDKLDVPRPGEAHAVVRAAAIVRAALSALGLPAPPAGLPAARLAPSLLSAPERRSVVLVVGAGKPANRLPAPLLAGVADRLAVALDLPVDLVGGGGDRRRAAEVSAACKVARPVDRCATTLAATARALAGAAVVVGGDTGPVHLARALGRPVVALFHAADPTRTGPGGLPGAAPLTVLAGTVACSPCRATRCQRPDGRRICLATLGPDRVAEAVVSLLRR
jgi:heptosyltransferase-1